MPNSQQQSMPLSPQRRLLNKLLLGIAVLAFGGFADSAYLTADHYLALPVPCTVLHGCDVVLHSAYSMVGPIPLALIGDVTARDFLEAHNLLPEFAPATELMICVVEPDATSHAVQLAQSLRRDDVAVAVNFSGKRIGDQIRQADKMKVPFVIAVGKQERDSGRYTVKNLESGRELQLPADRIAEHLFSSLG